MVACLWAFDGWADLNFMAEELHDPEKELPRVLFCSILLVTISYITANVAYLSVLSSQTIQESQSIAVDFGIVISGNTFASFLSLGVALSTTGLDIFYDSHFLKCFRNLNYFHKFYHRVCKWQYHDWRKSAICSG